MNAQLKRLPNLDESRSRRMSTPLEVFCCYAREDQVMLEHLKKHLTPLQRQGQITIWSDTNLNAGVEWEKELHQHLESADLILLLISPDFMASDYCYSIEMGRAIVRQNEGSAQVIPILLRSTFWQNASFAKLQIIPTNANPVINWPDRDDAFHDITMHISRVIVDLQTRRQLFTDQVEKIRSLTNRASYTGLAMTNKNLTRLERYVLSLNSTKARETAVLCLKEVLCVDIDPRSPRIREIRQKIMNAIKVLVPKDLGIFFQDSEMEYLDLCGIDFSGAVLTDVSFKHSFLVEASFEGAILDGANFTDCSLRNANFRNASMRNVDLTNADWFNVSGLEKQQLELTNTRTLLPCPSDEKALHKYLQSHYAYPFSSWSEHVQQQLITTWDQYLKKGGLCKIVATWKEAER